MKRLLSFGFTLFALAAAASIVVIVNPTSQPQTNRVVRVLPSADTLGYLGKTNAYINPPFAPGVDLSSAWVSNGIVVNIDPALLASYASSNAAWWTLAQKTNAVKLALSFADGTNGEQRFMRAMLLTILSQINTLRTNPTATLSAIPTNQVLLSISNAIVADPK